MSPNMDWLKEWARTLSFLPHVWSSMFVFCLGFQFYLEADPHFQAQHLFHKLVAKEPVWSWVIPSFVNNLSLQL